MKLIKLFSYSFILLMSVSSYATAGLYGTYQPIYASNGMVVSEDSIATKVGVDILKQGGNAVDAAIAVGYALSVTYPHAAGLGGGGFMLVYDAKNKKTVAIDYREEASKEIIQGHGVIGTPGMVKGFDMAYDIYATKPLKELLQPAVSLAKNGFKVSRQFSDTLKKYQPYLAKHPTISNIFYKNGKIPYEQNEIIIQKNLAWSLKQIANNGANAFYNGKITTKLLSDIKQNNGSITKQNLASYEAVMLKPITTKYRGYTIATMPPPSSGGIHLIQMFNILENYPLNQWGQGSANTSHIMVEAMKLAYADKSKYSSNGSMNKIIPKGITSKLYSKRLIKTLSFKKTTPSSLIEAGALMPFESPQTTHFIIIDKWGNVVSNSFTLNTAFGSGKIAKGTGIIWNNALKNLGSSAGNGEIVDRLSSAGSSHLVGGFRPRSSMAPTIVLKDNYPILATGSPGGNKIITTVLQLISNVLDHSFNLATATIAPRIHHQFQPDEVYIEQGYSIDTIGKLKDKGHKIIYGAKLGSAQSIMQLEDGTFVGFTDPRNTNGLALGY